MRPKGRDPENSGDFFMKAFHAVCSKTLLPTSERCEFYVPIITLSALRNDVNAA